MSAHQIFISYARADEPHYKQLETHLSTLIEQGLISLWHDGQTPLGSDTAETIDAHLFHARIILLLVSSDFLASDPCKHQMEQALRRSQAGSALLIPIRVRPCDLKGLPIEKLRALPMDGNPISAWASVDQDQAWAQVVTGLRQMIEAFPQSSTSVPSALHPPIWNIPYPRNAFFTGRDELLTRLSTALKGGRAAALSQAQAISGLGGIGKTQIALEYAYQHAHDYQAVLWTLADTRDALISGYVTIAELLDLPQKSEQDQAVVIQAVKRWLQVRSSWLLILDNADDLGMVREFIPSSFDGHLLLTTRAQSMGRLAKRVEVDTMDQDVGTLFLLRRVGLIGENASLDGASSSDMAGGHSICEELGGLPLALDQAGAFMEETQCSLAEYLHLYRIRRTEILKARGGLVDDHPASVATTWSLSFASVEEKNQAFADLLRLCAFLAPDGIPEEMITKAAEHLGPHLQELRSDPLLLSKAVAALGAYSLIRRDASGNTLSVHRLVQAVLKDGMDESLRKQWAERTVLAVNLVFPQVEFATWPQCERYLSHANACANLVEQEQIGSLAAADLLSKVGWYLDDRAWYPDAERVYKQALEIREQKLGTDHTSTASSLHNLAALYQNQGKYREAEELYQRALGIKEQALGGTHPSTGNTLHEMARLYQNQGKYREAEELCQRALGIYEQALGEAHPSTGSTLHEMAVLYQAQGKYREAEELYQRALGIKEQALGDAHPSTGSTLHQLGYLYQDQGKYREAEELYQRALGISEQALGDAHPSTGTTLHEMARLYQKQGKYREAEEWYQRALRIKEQALGDAHPSTGSTLHQLASLYYSQKKYKEAEPLFHRALTIYERALGEEHPDTALSVWWAAFMYEQQNEYEKAKLSYRRAFTVFERILGLEHPNTRSLRQQYVSLLRKMECEEEAALLEAEGHLPKKPD